MIICYIWDMTMAGNNFYFFILGYFLPFYHADGPENINF